MANEIEKKAQLGSYRRDQAGLCHYRMDSMGSIQSALVDALKHVPSKPSWFWFNGTPAPIVSGDNADSLYKRWNEWRSAYQSNADLLLEKLLEWSESA